MKRIIRVVFAGILGLAGATTGLAGATIGLATTSTEAPCQAVCQEIWHCQWAGTPQSDLYRAFLDARNHGTRTGHSVRIKGLPGSLPPISGGLSSQRGQPRSGLVTAANARRYRARCTRRSWAGSVECSWAGPVRNDLAPALTDAAHHESTFEHTTTIEDLTANREGNEADSPLLAQVQTYTWSGWAIVKWPGRTLGNERTEVVYESGTTIASSPNEAAAYGYNQFRYGRRLRELESRGASIDRCHVTAAPQR